MPTRLNGLWRLSSIAALLFSLRAEAQAPLRLGVFGGINSASISDLSIAPELFDLGFPSSSNRRTGAQFGAYLTWPLRSGWPLQPVLHFVQKGVRIDERIATFVFLPNDGVLPGEPFDATFGVNLSYLEVPLLVRLDAAATRRWRPFAVLGPSFAYRTDCRQTVLSSGRGDETDCDEERNNFLRPELPGNGDFFRKTDFGGVIGDGITTAASGRDLSVQLRYSQSLLSIARDDTDSVSPRNSGILLLVGVGF